MHRTAPRNTRPLACSMCVSPALVAVAGSVLDPVSSLPAPEKQKRTRPTKTRKGRARKDGVGRGGGQKEGKVLFVPASRGVHRYRACIDFRDYEEVWATQMRPALPSVYGAVPPRSRLSRVGSRGQKVKSCLLYTSPSPRDRTRPRMPSSA